MQLVQWVSGLLKGLLPASAGASTAQPNTVLALNSSGLIDALFVQCDGGNSASVYELPSGSTISGGRS